MSNKLYKTIVRFLLTCHNFWFSIYRSEYGWGDDPSKHSWSLAWDCYIRSPALWPWSRVSVASSPCSCTLSSVSSTAVRFRRKTPPDYPPPPGHGSCSPSTASFLSLPWSERPHWGLHGLQGWGGVTWCDTLRLGSSSRCCSSSEDITRERGFAFFWLVALVAEVSLTPCVRLGSMIVYCLISEEQLNPVWFSSVLHPFDHKTHTPPDRYSVAIHTLNTLV